MEKKLITAFPFEGKTIEEIIQAGSQYDIHETNHGHSYEILMNQDILDVNEKEKGVMAFIKFMEEEITRCLGDSDIETIDSKREEEITTFISMILVRIGHMVSTLTKEGERPRPYDVRTCLGQREKYGDIYLYDIIELIMNVQGYMHVSGTIDEIREIENNHLSPDDLTKAIDEKIKELINANVSYGSK